MVLHAPEVVCHGPGDNVSRGICTAPTYTANMAVPKLEPTVDTLEKLAASYKFRMTIELNTDIAFKALVDNKMWQNYIFKIYYTVMIDNRRPRVGLSKSLETLSVEIRNFCSPTLWMRLRMWFNKTACIQGYI